MVPIPDQLLAETEETELPEIQRQLDKVEQLVIQ
jgi:hypothetical protein